jgi:hypothetical protein
MLWAEGGAVGRIALAVIAAAAIFTGDIPLACLSLLTKNLNLAALGIAGKIFAVFLMRPAPLVLLVSAIFYLWVYLKRSRVVAGGAPRSGQQAKGCAMA